MDDDGQPCFRARRTRGVQKKTEAPAPEATATALAVVSAAASAPVAVASAAPTPPPVVVDAGVAAVAAPELGAVKAVPGQRKGRQRRGQSHARRQQGVRRPRQHHAVRRQPEQGSVRRALGDPWYRLDPGGFPVWRRQALAGLDRSQVGWRAGSDDHQGCRGCAKRNRGSTLTTRPVQSQQPLPRQPLLPHWFRRPSLQRQLDPSRAPSSRDPTSKPPRSRSVLELGVSSRHFARFGARLRIGLGGRALTRTLRRKEPCQQDGQGLQAAFSHAPCSYAASKTSLPGLASAAYLAASASAAASPRRYRASCAARVRSARGPRSK